MRAIAICLAVFITALSTAPPAQAGFKIRGWYQKNTAKACFTRKVMSINARGKRVVATIRVCR